MHFTFILILSSLTMALQPLAYSQTITFPSKPLRLIAPFPTGPTQIMAHLVSEVLAKPIAQPVVVDYRPGAGGNLGAEIAARSLPDGYTLVILNTSHGTSSGAPKALSYDLVKDFAPISLAATVSNLITVHPSLPVKSLKELASLARASPGKIAYGSAGVGSSTHLAPELFASINKVKLLHVPYKGVTSAMTNILAGEVDTVVATVPSAMPFINTGRLRGLAILGTRRVVQLPQLPTSVEAGMPDLLLSSWYGVAAPAGTRTDIVERLNRHLSEGMQTSEIKQRLAKVGMDATSSTPVEFSDHIKAKVARWTRVIREQNIQLN
jgi:tripartite-type tricarboxylate transporter receptor subunit TctC